MEMLRSLRGDKHEFCLTVIKFKHVRSCDVRCLQEVRWRGQDARMLAMKRRRHKLWWSGKDGVSGVEVLVKGDLCL